MIEDALVVDGDLEVVRGPDAGVREVIDGKRHGVAAGLDHRLHDGRAVIVEHRRERRPLGSVECGHGRAGDLTYERLTGLIAIDAEEHELDRAIAEGHRNEVRFGAELAPDLLLDGLEHRVGHMQVGVEVQEATAVFHARRRRYVRIGAIEHEPHGVVAGFSTFGAACDARRFRRQKIERSQIAEIAEDGQAAKIQNRFVIKHGGLLSLGRGWRHHDERLRMFPACFPYFTCCHELARGQYRRRSVVTDHERERRAVACSFQHFTVALVSRLEHELHAERAASDRAAAEQYDVHCQNLARAVRTDYERVRRAVFPG